MKAALLVVFSWCVTGCHAESKKPRVLDQTAVATKTIMNTNPCQETSDFRTRKPGEKLPVCTGAGQKPLPDVNTTAAPGTVIQSGSGTVHDLQRHTGARSAGLGA